MIALQGILFGAAVCAGLFYPLGLVPVAMCAGAVIAFTYAIERHTNGLHD